MSDPVRVTVDPPPGARVRQVLDELGGREGAAVHRIWAGQPRSRCPWRVVDTHLVLDPPGGRDAQAWLGFLLREVLAPTSQGGTARARTLGLHDQHRLQGTFTARDHDGHLVRWRLRGRRVVAAGLVPPRRHGDYPGPA